MYIKAIDEITLDKFLASQEDNVFFHYSSWAEVGKKRNFIPHLLGFYQENNLKATAILLEKKVLAWSIFYLPRGFCLNYLDNELLKEVILLTKEYVYKHKGLYFYFDPELIWHYLNDEAKIKETIVENEKLIESFKKLKAKWRGKTLYFNQMSNPRFTFLVPLKNDLLVQAHPTIRKILKRNNPYNLKIYKGNKDDIAAFYEVMASTAKTKNIYLEPLSYFKDFYETLAQKQQADIWLAKIDIAKLKNYYRTKIASLEKEKNNLDANNKSPKNSAKLKDFTNQINKLNKELKEANSLPEKELTLSAIITAKAGNKVSTIHGGNSIHLRSLYANYELYYHILLDAKEKGYDYVDLFGSEGEINPQKEEYGIFLFKLRFGGYFIEYIGEFIIYTRPILAFIFKTLLTIKRKIQTLIKRGITK